MEPLMTRPHTADRAAPAPLARPAGEVISSREEAEHYVGLVCFKIGPPALVGVELEWLVHDAHDPTAPLTRARLAEALGEWGPRHLRPDHTDGRCNEAHNPAPPVLPRGSTVTVEPGGQVELSSQPAATLGDCLADMATDSETLRNTLALAGLTASGHGIDPHRPPQRILDLPRYAAMETFFDRSGPAGRTMMCSTAAVQVSLDAGTDSTGSDSVAARWHALHALGPALVATFANSPVHAGVPTGWQSSRQGAWAGIHAARGVPASGSVDPRDAYARFALDAPVLCVRCEGHPWGVPEGVTFADWLAGALDAPPTFADLDYHLTTLFPPVRAQGHLEVRYVDAQPGDGWVVPSAVLWALCADATAMDTALAAAEPVAGEWLRAARVGMDDPELARAGWGVLDAAITALKAAPEAAAAVATFAERYALRGRSPAHDWTEPERGDR
jgi:glutamate--cysteine ligase